LPETSVTRLRATSQIASKVLVGSSVGVFVGTAVGVYVGLGQLSYVTTSCGRELVVVAGVLPNKGWLLKDANESGGGAEFVPVQ